MKLTRAIQKALFVLAGCLVLQLVFAGAAAIPTAAKEGPPSVMSYEGYVTDVNGVPLPDGSYDFSFGLYTSPEGGSPVWEERHKNVTVKNGFIRLYLGRGTPPRRLDIPFDRQYFLGVRLGQEPEMMPRLELTATAYSFRAKMAEEVVDGSITNDKLAPLSVTDENIKSISWSKITDIPEAQATGRGPTGGVPANVWSLFGNRKTDCSEDFIGTTDFQGLVLKTDSVERMKIRDTGDVDIALNLNIGRNATVGDNLVVGNDASIGHDLGVGNNLEVENDALIGQNLDVGNDASIGNDLEVGNNLDVIGLTHLRNETESTDRTNGALVVDGGVGIGKSLNVYGNTAFEQDLAVGGQTSCNSELESTDPTSGSLIVKGGAGIGKRINVGGDAAFLKNVGIGRNAYSNVTLAIQSPQSNDRPFDLKIEGTDNWMTVDNGAGVTIKSDKGGGDNDIHSYPLVVMGRDQGMAITLDGSTNNDNNFITFWDDDGRAGRIEGQTLGEYESHPVTVATHFYLGELVFAEAIAIGTAILGVPIDPSAIVSLAADIWYITEIWEIYNALNVGVSYASGSGDYAEWLPRLEEGEDIEAGDIVGVFGGKISKCTENAQQILPISLSPIVLGNMPPEGQEHLYDKVAFMGQVAVKVSGPVSEGDFIIPSGLEDGTGIAVPPEMMTADEYAKVVGRAWDASDAETVKYINVAVGLNPGDIAEIVKRQQAELHELRRELAARSDDVRRMQADLDEFRAQLATVSDLRETVLQLRAAIARYGEVSPAASQEAKDAVVAGHPMANVEQ